MGSQMRNAPLISSVRVGLFCSIFAFAKGCRKCEMAFPQSAQLWSCLAFAIFARKCEMAFNQNVNLFVFSLLLGSICSNLNSKPTLVQHKSYYTYSQYNQTIIINFNYSLPFTQNHQETLTMDFISIYHLLLPHQSLYLKLALVWRLPQVLTFNLSNRSFKL